MLTISTIPEALAELERRTGRAWTDSELFDLAANCSIELHAAPPITARTTIQKFVIGEGLVEKFRSGPGHARLAVLFPWQVGQLWISGETMAVHTEKHNEIEDEYQFFTEGVRVTREQVRIKDATLQKILAVWNQAQAGRWLENDKKPGDMRYQTGPDWMFPIVPQQPAPAQSPATPAPVGTESASGGVDDWRNAVRAEAWEQWVKIIAENGTPTLENVSLYLASWCEKNNVKGNLGRFPRASYLQTNIINGKHWAPPRNMSREAAKKHLEQKKHEKGAN